DSLRALLPYKGNLDAGMFVGLTPLMFMAGHGNLPAVKLLLKAGADVNAANESAFRVKNGVIALSRLTALMLSASDGSPEMIRTLLDAGAKVNATDVRGMTPLMFATASDVSDPRVVRMLLDRRADPHAKSVIGETVSDWARKFGHPENLRLLHAAPSETAAVLRPAQFEKKDRRRAVESAVSLLQGSVTEYFKQSGCVGCHHQNLAGAAVGHARRNGFRVDEAAAAEHLRVTKSEFLGQRE